MDWRGRWCRGAGAGIGAVCAVGGALLVWDAANAAFTATTDNPANAFEAGSVVLSDDDAGSALFTASALGPGSSRTSCLTVRYDGTLPGTVRLHVTTTGGALASDLLLTLEEGTGGTGTSCAGFTPDSSALVDVPLLTVAADHHDYATGTGSWSVTGPGQTRRYRLTASVDPDATDAAQGETTSTTLTWEARDSSDPSSDRYAAAVLASGPALYYRLADTGGIAADEVGGADGIVVGGPLALLPSATGDPADRASAFDGVDDYVQLPAPAPDVSAGLTIEAWADLGATDSWERVVELGDGRETNNVFVGRLGVTDDLVFRIHENGIFNELQVPGVLRGTLQHIVVTQTPTGLATIYVDGRVEASGSLHLPGPGPRAASAIGRSGWSEDALLSGTVDDLAIYTRALTAAEVEAHHRAGS